MSSVDLETTPVMSSATRDSSLDTQKEKDWLKISGIVIAIFAAIGLIFSIYCTNGIFPRELLGNTSGLISAYVASFYLLAIGGGLFLYRHFFKSEN